MAFKNLDFLNANTLRSYPIKEGLTRRSTDDTFTLPDDFMVDLMIAASSDISKRFYVSKVVNLPDVITVEIKDQSDVVVGSFSITVSSHILYKDYFMVPGSSYPKANGRLTVASLDTMQAAATGSFSFTFGTAELEMRTVVPTFSTISTLTLQDSTGKQYTYTGNVRLVARKNIRFKGDSTFVYVDAGEGLGLNAECENQPVYIETINGQPPDDDKNFTIIPADCASITPLSGSNASGLLLSDTCCKPCMGCDEISTLTERAMQLESDILKFRDHYNKLQQTVLELSNLMNYTCEC